MFVSLVFAGTALFAAGTLEDHYAAAVAAYQSGDSEAMIQATDALTELRPHSPRFIYFSAAAHALHGDGDTANTLLERLASQGLSMQPDKEPAFASMKDNEDFQRLIYKFSKNAEPIGELEVVVSHDDGHFIPESVVYDAQSNSHFLGSVRRGTILRIDQDGNSTVFADRTSTPLFSVFGMHLNPQTRSLFVATTAAEELEDVNPEQIGKSGILEFNLDDGKLQASHWLPDANSNHWLGDFALANNYAYATDSLSGAIWKLNLKDGKWEILVEPANLNSAQGITISPNGKTAFVADYSSGIWRVDLASGEHQQVHTDEHINTHGTDGLYWYANGLIAVQNGYQPHRVMYFSLDADLQRITNQKVLASGHEVFDDPTLGYVNNQTFTFVANSHWPSFDQDKNLPDAGSLSGPQVVRVKLP